MSDKKTENCIIYLMSTITIIGGVFTYATMLTGYSSTILKAASNVPVLGSVANTLACAVTLNGYITGSGALTTIVPALLGAQICGMIPIYLLFLCTHIWQGEGSNILRTLSVAGVCGAAMSFATTVTVGWCTFGVLLHTLSTWGNPLVYKSGLLSGMMDSEHINQLTKEAEAVTEAAEAAEAAEATAKLQRSYFSNTYFSLPWLLIANAAPLLFNYVLLLSSIKSLTSEQDVGETRT